MSAILTPSRIEVVDALGSAGIQAFEYAPDVMTAPGAIVGPDDPYLEPPTGGVPFKNYVENLQILLVAGKGTNKAVAATADDLIEKAVTALHNDWDVTYVGAPGQVTLGGTAFLGVAIFIKRPVKL